MRRTSLLYAFPFIGLVLVSTGVLKQKASEEAPKPPRMNEQVITSASDVKTNSSFETMVSSMADSIEGTKRTHKHLNGLFPFGYVVISKRDGLWIFARDPSNKQHWDLARLSQSVTVEPNFKEKMVRWKFPNMSISESGKLLIGDSFASGENPMDEDTLYFPYSDEKVLRRKPYIYLMTLSDSETHPVFAFGFRIPTEILDSPNSTSPALSP
jgi:hypothetical protein